MKKSFSWGKILKIVLISIIIFIAIIALIVIGLVLALDNYWFHPSDKNFHKASPVKNPHPTYFMTVSGKVSTDLVGRVHPVLIMLYITQKKYDENSICYYPVNRLEGVYDDRNRYLIYPIHIQKNGYYQIKVPMNYYLPGACNWQLTDINYSIYSRHYINSLRIVSEHQRLEKYIPSMGLISLDITKKKSLPTPLSGTKNLTNNLYCYFNQKKRIDCDYSNDLAKSGSLQISAKMNFNWTVNITKESKS